MDTGTAKPFLLTVAATWKRAEFGGEAVTAVEASHLDLSESYLTLNLHV